MTSTITSLTNNYLYQDFKIPSKIIPENADMHKAPVFTEKQTIPRKKKIINLPVLISTAIGTIIPILIIRKNASKAGETVKKCPLRFFDGNIELKELLLLGSGPIIGGLLGGIASDEDKKHRKHKIKEAVFQLCNLTIPTSLVAVGLELVKKSKSIKENHFAKIGAIAAGLAAGMPTALFLSNKINDKVFDSAKNKDRQLKPKDGFIHIDDIIGALTLGKVPLLDKIPVERMLPFVYGINGYMTGNKE